MTRLGRWSAIAAIVLGAVTVLTWRRGEDRGAAAGPMLDGSQLFHAKGCSSCHAGPSSSAAFSNGVPSLADAAAWAGDRREGMSAEDYLAESMRSPSAFISPAFAGGVGPMTAMPLLRLSDAEIDALVEYLLTS